MKTTGTTIAGDYACFDTIEGRRISARLFPYNDLKDKESESAVEQAYAMCKDMTSCSGFTCKLG